MFEDQRISTLVRTEQADPARDSADIDPCNFDIGKIPLGTYPGKGEFAAVANRLKRMRTMTQLQWQRLDTVGLVLVMDCGL